MRYWHLQAEELKYIWDSKKKQMFQEEFEAWHEIDSDLLQLSKFVSGLSLVTKTKYFNKNTHN